MLQRAAGNAYSWWWASHIRTKQSKWLEQNLQDMEEKVHSVMALVSEDGDSFAKRAEMYYKKRPEIVIFVEEAYRAYRALAERYDHISTELQNANNTIAYVFPEQVQMAMEEEDDLPFIRKGGSGTPPDLPKGNIPKVPKFSKELKGMFQSATKNATKKLQPKKSMKRSGSTSSSNVSKSGLNKKEAFREIDKLQKQVLGLQTEKEFVKSSYENGLAKYWEIDQQIREIQDKACTLQEEFGAETVIEDDEARSVMTSTALRSCREILDKLEEKQEKSVEEVKIERKRIREAKEKLESLRNPDANLDTKEKLESLRNPDANLESSASASASADTRTSEHDEIRAMEQQRQEIEVLREKIKKHFEASADTCFTVSEMAEKIDELVNKVIGLEAAVSSQSALIQRMRNETDELHGQIRSLEEEESVKVSLNEKLEEMERMLEGIREINDNVEDQSTNLQTNFMEAKCNLDHLYEKMGSVKPDEEIHIPQPVTHMKKTVPKFEPQQQPIVKGKNIRNAVAEFDSSIKEEREKREKEMKQQKVADEIKKAREARKKVKKPVKEKKEKKVEKKDETETVARDQVKEEADVRTEEKRCTAEEGRRDDNDVSKAEETRQPKEQEDDKKERDDSEEGTRSNTRHDDPSENAVTKQKSLKKLNHFNSSAGTDGKVEAATSSLTTMADDSVQQVEERKDGDSSKEHKEQEDSAQQVQERKDGDSSKEHKEQEDSVQQVQERKDGDSSREHKEQEDSAHQVEERKDGDSSREHKEQEDSAHQVEERKDGDSSREHKEEEYSVQQVEERKDGDSSREHKEQEDSVQQVEERKDEDSSREHKEQEEEYSSSHTVSRGDDDSLDDTKPEADKGKHKESLEVTNEDKRCGETQQPLRKLRKLSVEEPEKVAAAATAAVTEMQGNSSGEAAADVGGVETRQEKLRKLSVEEPEKVAAAATAAVTEMQRNSSGEAAADVGVETRQEKLRKLSVEEPEKVAAAATAAVTEMQGNSSGEAAADVGVETRQETPGEAADDVGIEKRQEIERSAEAKEAAKEEAKKEVRDHDVKTEDNAGSKNGSEDDEPDWKQLFFKGVENREQVLLTQYTAILRSYKEVKQKLTESEVKGGDTILDITIQLRELKAANAKKDEQIRMLRIKLSQLQAGDNDENPDSPFAMDDMFAGLNLDLEGGISPMEERIRSSIDEVLEDNLDFWLRFSSTFQQVQQFETEVNDLQSELATLEEKLGKQDVSSHGKVTLKSDARPLYKHLREIHTELVVWIDKGMLLKDELKGRFAALCEIQDEITSSLKESAEDEEFRFTSYQAAKFQGEILNMKQENTRVGDELQAGLDHVTNLQIEVGKTLSRLNDKFKLSGSKNRQNITLPHSESRSRVPLRSFIFGVKQKRQKLSFLAVVHPGLHKKYNGLRSGLNI